MGDPEKPLGPIEVWELNCRMDGYHLDAEPVGYTDSGRSWLTPSYREVEDEVIHMFYLYSCIVYLVLISIFLLLLMKLSVLFFSFS